MTGASPSDILADSLSFDAYTEQAEAARWTDLHELLALNVEMTHYAMRQSMANAGAKQGDIPPPLHVPRPGDSVDSGDQPTVMRAHELATAMVKGIV